MTEDEALERGRVNGLWEALYAVGKVENSNAAGLAIMDCIKGPDKSVEDLANFLWALDFNGDRRAFTRKARAILEWLNRA